MCMSVGLCMSHICWCSWKPEEGIGSSGAGGDLPWLMRIKLDPLEEEKVFLTTEPSLKIQLLFFALCLKQDLAL